MTIPSEILTLVNRLNQEIEEIEQQTIYRIYQIMLYWHSLLFISIAFCGLSMTSEDSFGGDEEAYQRFLASEESKKYVRV